MITLAIIFNDRKLSGWLTRLFTGCYAYHVVWVDEGAGRMYDMNLIRRRRPWPHYPADQVAMYDAPVTITREYLEDSLTRDGSRYGVLDYLLFALRPLFHLVGRSTRNAGGVICSEMVNGDIWATGGETPWRPDGAPPSPCDLYRWLQSRFERGEIARKIECNRETPARAAQLGERGQRRHAAAGVFWSSE